MLEDLRKESAIFLFFNLSKKQKPDFLRIPIKILVQWSSEGTVYGSTKLLFKIQDRINKSFLEMLCSRRKKVEDVEDGGNDLHLLILLNESKGDPLKSVGQYLDVV
jgi:hypothetical protein